MGKKLAGGLLFVGLNVLDAYLTKLALSRWACEVMPLARLYGDNAH